MKWLKIVSIALLATALVATMSVIMPSGSKYCYGNSCGVFFWGAHEHDSVWHLGVINNLLTHTPFEMPNMSGNTIAGYNYLLDIVVALLVWVSRVDTSIWYFKVLPLIWFGTISYLSYVFAKTYRKSHTFPIFVWLFLFFGSSFSYAIKWYQTGSIWGGSSVISMQALQNMLNPQFAWSLIPLFLLLIGFNAGRREYKDYMFYGLYTAIAIGLKFYTGTAMLAIIAFDLVLSLSSDKKKILTLVLKGLSVLALTGLSIWIFYSPGTSSGLPFIWKPWATINPIIEDKNLFYLPTWAERLYAYHGIKLIGIELLVLAIFVVFNFGSRIVALFGITGGDENTNERSRKIIIFGSIVTAFLSVTLIQRGVWWNTVQFLYVSLFLTGLLASEAMDRLWQTRHVLRKVAVVGIVALMIPNNIDIVRSFTHFPGTGYIKSAEVETLERLKNLPAGAILTPDFSHKSQSGELAEIPHKYDTAYISAYSGHQTYLADLIQLELTNIDYQDRLKMVRSFDCKVLDEVGYIYEYRDSEFASKFRVCNHQIETIVENDVVTVYQVK